MRPTSYGLPFHEKTQFSHLVWAGRRCAVASRFAFFKGRMLYPAGPTVQTGGTPLTRRPPCSSVSFDGSRVTGDATSSEARAPKAHRSALEHFPFETLRVPNHTAWRFAEKTRFFRLVWAGRRCAAASHFAFFKGKML